MRDNYERFLQTENNISLEPVCHLSLKYSDSQILNKLEKVPLNLKKDFL